MIYGNAILVEQSPLGVLSIDNAYNKYLFETGETYIAGKDSNLTKMSFGDKIKKLIENIKNVISQFFKNVGNAIASAVQSIKNRFKKQKYSGVKKEYLNSKLSIVDPEKIFDKFTDVTNMILDPNETFRTMTSLTTKLKDIMDLYINRAATEKIDAVAEDIDAFVQDNSEKEKEYYPKIDDKLNTELEKESFAVTDLYIRFIASGVYEKNLDSIIKTYDSASSNYKKEEEILSSNEYQIKGNDNFVFNSEEMHSIITGYEYCLKCIRKNYDYIKQIFQKTISGMNSFSMAMNECLVASNLSTMDI